MAGGKFNTIVIVDTIPDGELNTAKLLRDSLKDIAAIIDGLHIRYARADTAQDVADLIMRLTDEVKNNGVLPSLHIEAHGFNDESGFVAASGEPCTWETLKDLVTPLNIVTNLNLMIVMAACFGGSFARAIRTTDRAPVWGILGPTRAITAGQLIDGFSAFYSAFFDEDADVSPFRVLVDSAPERMYYLTTPEEYFYQVWVNYKTKQYTDEELTRRARALQEQVRRNGNEPLPLDDIKQRILDTDPESFEKFRDH